MYRGEGFHTSTTKLPLSPTQSNPIAVIFPFLDSFPYESTTKKTHVESHVNMNSPNQIFGKIIDHQIIVDDGHCDSENDSGTSGDECYTSDRPLVRK